jgi:hypothetical protein
MSQSTGSGRATPFLAGFASIIGLIAICLFFSGWIYRWSYFSYFSIDVTSQNYTVQSFLMVPLQIYLGSRENIVRTVLVLALIPLLSFISIAILHRLYGVVSRAFALSPRLVHLWQRLVPVEAMDRTYLRAYGSLIDELVIVGWVLALLFWFSHHQGLQDAQRDAVNSTSTLPVVALVGLRQETVLGADLRVINDGGDPIADVALDSSVLIGERLLARAVRSTNVTSAGDDQVWRLLTYGDNSWLYLIQTIPAGTPAGTGPLVLAVPNARRGQMLILSPMVPELRP